MSVSVFMSLFLFDKAVNSPVFFARVTGVVILNKSSLNSKSSVKLLQHLMMKKLSDLLKCTLLKSTK